MGFPSTNNDAEGTNAVIKRNHIIKERLPVGQFLHNVVDLVRKWSSERRDPSTLNCTAFADEVTMFLKEWTEAYQWASQSQILERNGATFFVGPPG